MVNETFMLLSGVIQAQRTEFGDMYVSTFPWSSLLTLIFQPIIERFRLF